MPKPPFPDVEFWLRILTRLEELPQEQISAEAVTLIREFRQQNPNPTAMNIWNFLKSLHEFIIKTDDSASLVRATINVVPHYEPPQEK